MRIEIDPSKLNEEERALVRLMHRVRAIAGASIVGGIAVIAITADPVRTDAEQAAARGVAAPASAPGEGSLMALERGALG